jgi:hypothetical protein
MGTRGAVGWKLDGKWYSIYKQFDSYPDGLGAEVCDFVNNMKDWTHLKNRLKEVRKAVLKFDGSCGWNSDDLDKWDRNKGLEYITDVYEGKSNFVFTTEWNFLRESLMCEYAYILDLDDDKLLYFEGYNKEIDENSPFPQEWWDNPIPCNIGKYYPVVFIDSYRLDRTVNYRDFIISTRDLEIESLEKRVEELEKDKEAPGDD